MIMEHSWPKTWPNLGQSDVLHIFDPLGDVLLQLKNSSSVEGFTSDEVSRTLEEQPEEELVSEELAPEYAVVEEPVSEVPVLEEPASEEIAPIAEEGPFPEVPASEDSISERSVAEEPTVEETRAAKEEPTHKKEPVSNGKPAHEEEIPAAAKPEPPQDVYLQVSSRHLVLASAMFKTMLSSGTFSEGRNLMNKGNVIIPLSDDSDSLIILMNIIHGMTRKVPRKVTLHGLAKLAHLVNYYQLHEAVEPFSDMWIADLKQKAFPTRFSPRVVAWLFISWVFQKEPEFEGLTRILLYENDKEFQDLVDKFNKDFLIPPSIVNTIKKKRIEAITRIIKVVNDQITRYNTPKSVCTRGNHFACDSMVLGSLLKSSAAIGIFPPPQAPYHGITVKKLAYQVREMQILDSCDHRDRYYYSNSSHGVKNAIEASVESLEARLTGLKLDSFLLETKSNGKFERNGSS